MFIQAGQNPGGWIRLSGLFFTKNYAVVIDARVSAGIMGRVDLSETSGGSKQ